MAILNHGSSIRTTDGGQTTSTIVTAANIGSYAVASNATYYIGTTQNVFNRASGAQTLTGVSIDGNAANITAYTINQNLGTSNSPSFVRLTSTQSTGTSPFVVSSTTVVNNLNSDLLDGQHGSYYQDPGNLALQTSWTIPIQTANSVAGFLYGVFGDALAFRTISNLQYWDGSAWQTYTNSAIQSILTGNIQTFATVAPANRKFRFEFTAAEAYIGGGVLVVHQQWNIGAHQISSMLEYYNGTSWVTAITERSSASGENNYHFYNRGDIHGIWTQYRITITSVDTVNSTTYTGIQLLYDYTRSNLPNNFLPITWDYLKNVTATGSLRTPIFYDSDNTSYYLDPANSGTSMLVAGKVGIGTTSPGYALTVNGTIAYTPSAGNPVFIGNDGTYGTSGTGRYVALGFGGLANSANKIFAHNMGEDGLYICSATSRSIFFRAGGGATDHVVITSGGNLGVATTSADTNLQVVGHVHVGNQTTFENTGGWNKTIYLDGTIHARMRILGSAYASGKNSATETSIWVDNSVAPYSGLTTNAGSFTISAGFTTLTNSARSPIFYDSDNTAYYLDPASTSNLNTVTVNDVLTYGVVAAKSFSVSVNTSTYWTVVRPNGSSIATGYIYRITLCTTGTGTDTGEQYLLANVDSAGWVIKTVTKTGSGSNWPYVFLDAGVPKVKTDHPSLYTVTVLVEELNSGNTGGLPSVFGLAGLFTSDNGTPKYRAGWFSSDNTLLHSGNYGSYSTFSGSVTSTYGNFTTPGLIIGDAQYGFYVVSGNVYYKSASGGVHYWRNIANSANTMSLDNSGILTVSGNVSAPIFYDSNDTSYYVDPSSISRVSTLYVAGTLADSASLNGRIILSGNLHIDAYGAYDIYCNYYSGRRFRTFKGAGTGAEIFRTDTDGIVYAYEQLRTPILYDHNDTNYYLNPASSSVLNTLSMAGTITGALDATVSFTGGVCTAASYNYILNGANDTGNKLVIFVNGSTRTADGGVNALTIRNDGGAFVLGSASYLTSILGSSVTINGNAALTSASTLTAGNLSGTIPSGVLGNSTLYVGTTAIALNRGSASQTLTGTSIDGNAATATTATNSTQLGGVAAANYVRNDVDGSNSTALFRLTTITKSLTITTSWLDTGIVGADLATGCYMISVYVDNYAVSGGHYQETYTGMMSWFSTGTNSTDYDEIVLHKSGHASNGAYINLRTIRQLSGSTNLKLQIISSVSTSGASNYVFKFRRLI